MPSPRCLRSSPPFLFSSPSVLSPFLLSPFSPLLPPFLPPPKPHILLSLPLISQYVNSIFSYYHKVEGNTAVPPTYMAQQTDINDKMRAILVDWLVEVRRCST